MPRSSPARQSSSNPTLAHPLIPTPNSLVERVSDLRPVLAARSARRHDPLPRPSPPRPSCPSSSGRRSNRCCRHLCPAMAAALASMTVRRWPGSSTSSTPASPWRLLPTDQLGCGSPITCWRRLHDWQHAGVWRQLHSKVLDELGHSDQLDWSRASLDSLSVRAKRGGTGRSQSSRPWQARQQVPPAGRPARRPAGGRPVGGQHPRLDAVGSHGRRRPTREGPARQSGRPRKRPAKLHGDKGYD
jgi:transposase